MASLFGLPSGMYSCLNCAEYIYGSTNDIQDFISEHMCEKIDKVEKTQRLKESMAIVESIVESMPQDNTPAMMSRPLYHHFPLQEENSGGVEQGQLSMAPERMVLQTPFEARPLPSSQAQPPPPPPPPPKGWSSRAPLADLNGRLNQATKNSKYFPKKV